MLTKAVKLKNIFRFRSIKTMSKSIRWKIIFYFYLGLIIPLMLVSFFTLRNILNNLFDQYARSDINLLIVIGNDINNYYNELSELPLFIYRESNIFDFLAEGHKMNTIDIVRNQRNLDVRLKSIVFSRNDIENLKCYTSYNSSISIINRSGIVSNTYIDDGDMSELLPVYNNGDILSSEGRFTPLYNGTSEDANEKSIFAYSQPILDSPGTRVIGIISFDINMSELDKKISQINKSFEEVFCIIDESNNLMYQSGNEYREDSEIIRLIQSESDLEKEGYRILNTEKGKVLFSYMTLEDHPWMLAKITPTSVFYQDTSSYLRNSIIIVVFILIIMSFLIIFTSYKIAKPINALALSMKKVESGNFNVEVKDEGNYSELSTLINSFNLMAKEIHQLFNEKYKLKLEQQTVEFKALQAQINPHFLNNTLQTISYMALKRNAYEINSVVTAMREYMQYCISFKEDIVTLEKEIYYVEKYVIIQKFRYLNKLKVTINVQESVKNSKIPKMILQPLVENSVIHGLENGNGKCSILMDCSQKGQNVVIRITDDGKGISEDKLREIRENLKKNDELLIRQNERIGLTNIHYRMKLLYNDKYSMRIDSVENKETTVTLMFPVS